MASYPADTRPSASESSPFGVKKVFIVPVGLNFGPTQLSITFFANDSEYYTGVPGGEPYKSFFNDALSKEVPCSLERIPGEIFSASGNPSFTTGYAEMVETFSKLIKGAINMAVWALDNNPTLKFKLMAVAVPDHWGESARTLVADATKAAGHPLDGSHMIVPLSRAIQSTFQMSRCAEGKYLTLLLDYNKSYLHLMLVEMGGTGCMMKRQVYFPRLGEDELHKDIVLLSAVAPKQDSLTHKLAKGEPFDSLGLRLDEASSSSQSTNASSGSDLMFPITEVHTDLLSHRECARSNREPTIIGQHASRESNADPPTVPDYFNGQRPVCNNKAAHFKPIIDTVSKFMIETKATENQNPAEKPVTPKYGPRELRDAVRNVKYIVIDGEASIPGLWDLRDAIKGKFCNEEWITIEANKRDCGAYGAALAARRQLENPKHMGDWKDLPGYVPEGGALR